ncbi:MAG: hypothetical protein HOW71_16860 [Nonomuraea sp.]|nr:hypothetical protein [Nonomuraea sp.]
MQLRTIGGHTVSAIGLGGLPLSIEERPEEDRSIATIHAALDAGITFIDTADGDHREANGVSHNEELSARARSKRLRTRWVPASTRSRSRGS